MNPIAKLRLWLFGPPPLYPSSKDIYERTGRRMVPPWPFPVGSAYPWGNAEWEAEQAWLYGDCWPVMRTDMLEREAAFEQTRKGRRLIAAPISF
jgi:hypothetical protein